MYTLVPDKSFGQLLDISPKNFILIKTFDSHFLYIKVWFTDQNYKPLEIEDKILDQILVKCYGFLSFAEYMGKNISKNINCKYGQKLLDHDKQSATDAIKTTSKKVIQKAAEATGDLIGIRMLIELRKSQEVQRRIMQKKLQMNMIKEYLKKDIYISPEEGLKVIDDLRLT